VCGDTRGRAALAGAPPKETFEELAVLGIAEGIELGGGPALKVSQAPVAGRQHPVTNQQAA
jgi:hypothetical protein